MDYIWKKKKLNVRVYEPEQRLGLRKEHALPLASYIGSKLSVMGGSFSLFIHGFFASVHGLFRAKSKIREVQMKHEKVLDLRRRH
jgi:hypothetical protein